MFAAHVYIDGRCREAIELYKKAFNAEVKTIIPYPQDDKFIAHAEILIHGVLLMLNDFGGGEELSEKGGYQLSVQFSDVDELKHAYSVLEEGSSTIMPMQSTDYSPCGVRFADKYGVFWALWV